MVTYPFGGDEQSSPSALDAATRVDVQEQMADALAENIGEAISARIDAQEAALRPIYRTAVRDIQRSIEEQAAIAEPIRRRVQTAINSRLATQQAMLDHIAADAGIQLKPINPGPPTPGVPTGVDRFAPITNGTGSVPIPTSPPVQTPTPTPAPTPGVVGGDIPPPDAIRGCFPCKQANGQPGFYTWIRGNEHSPCYPPEQVSACSGIFPPPTTPTPTPTPKPIPAPTPPIDIPGMSCPATCPAPVINVTCPPTTPKKEEKEKEEEGTRAPDLPAEDEPGEYPHTRPLPPVRMDWCVPDPCDIANRTINGLRETVPATSQTIATDDLTVFAAAIHTTLSAAALTVADFAKRAIPGNMAEHIFAGAGQAVGRITVGTSTAGLLLRDLKVTGVRDEPVAALLSARLGAATLAEKETGLPLEYLTQTDRYLLQYSNPQYIPTQSEIDQAWLHGELTREQWDCWTRANGNIPQCRLPVVELQARKPDVHELIALYKRGLLGNYDNLVDHMRRLGVTSVFDIDRWLTVTQQLPTPADLIHLAIRDVFDPNKQGREEMIAEFREQQGMIELFEAQGYGQFHIQTRDGRKLAYNAAELEWLASYEEASPTQTYEMLHRLRPGRVQQFAQHIPDKRPDELRTIMPGADIRPSPDGKGSIVTPRPMTLYGVAKNLKEKDYNPIWRDKLAAISYRVIGRIDLRRLYRTGVFGNPVGTTGFIRDDNNRITPTGQAEKELVERYQDEGYNYLDATLLAYYTASEMELSKSNKLRTSSLTRICHAYKLGILDKQTAIEQTRKVTLDEQEARFRIDQCDLDHRIAVVRQTIAATRGDYLRFRIGEDEARKRLVDAGVDRVRINDLLQLWRVQLQGVDREVATSELCAWYNEGQITREEYKKRLRRMGYDLGDVDRIVKHCELGEFAKQQKVRDRLAKAAERERQRRLSAVEREAKERERAEKERMLRFLRTRTEKNLLAWWQEGLITEGEIYTTLVAKGYIDADARRWITANNPNGGTGSGGSGG